MLLYCLKCRKNTEHKNPKVLTKCALCAVKNQDLSGSKKPVDY